VREFGDEFRKVGSDEEIHHTPWGAEQEFVYCYCRTPGDARVHEAGSGR